MVEAFTESEMNLVRACPLFAGMDDAEIAAALPVLNARRRHFAKGTYAQRADEPFRYAGLVLSGAVTGQFVTEEYNMVTLTRYTPGGFFGLTFALVARPKSPVQILASEDSDILLFEVAGLFSANAEPGSPEERLRRNLVGALVQQNLFLNRRVRILSQGSIRNRLLYYLAECDTDEQGFAKVPFSRTELAGFLSVNRSALSREIGAMQREGLLELEGPRLRLVRR